MSEQIETFDFGGMASSYDAWYETRLGCTYDALEKRAVERMLPDPADGDRLLDVGCGTGHWSAFFGEHGFTVSGVDISQEMVGVARGKDIRAASFEVADAHALPFEEGRFDVVAAITTLEFVRDAEGVVGEMARCTRGPGGVILVGALNALAGVNLRRKAAGKRPYRDARLFSPRQVKAILAAYGKPLVRSTTFVPQAAWAMSLAPLCDLVGQMLRLPNGAFVVGKVAVEETR